MSDILDPYTPRPVDLNADQVLDPYPKTGRRVKLAVSWESKAIVRDLAPHLKSLTYTDNLSGAADDLAIVVEDRDGKWSGESRPTFGDKVVARLEAEGWFGKYPVNSLRLGTFAHDSISLSGPPMVATVKCVSAPLATGLRRRKRTHAWRRVSLKTIAQDIADRARSELNATGLGVNVGAGVIGVGLGLATGFSLKWDGPEGAKYEKVLQNDKSDLEFLQELCKEVGRTLKVTESAIVIYDEQNLDKVSASGDIDLIGGWVLGWNFDSDDSGRYGSCHIKCLNPRTGKVVQYEFPAKGETIPGLDPNGQTLELAISVSNAAEAAVRAQKLLRAENRFATRGKITTVGDPGLVAGVTFNLTNAFGFDGKFIITHAVHNAIGGYTCTLDVRRCIEGY